MSSPTPLAGLGRVHNFYSPGAPRHCHSCYGLRRELPLMYYQELLSTIILILMPSQLAGTCRGHSTRWDLQGAPTTWLSSSWHPIDRLTTQTSCHAYMNAFAPGADQSTRFVARKRLDMADVIAGTIMDSSPDIGKVRLTTLTRRSFMPAGTWQWQAYGSSFYGSLKKVQHYYYRQNTKKRDMKRIYANIIAVA